MPLCFLAHSQEADDLGNYAEFTFIPRLDLNLSTQNSEFGADLGNSSIYTLFEGSAGEHFSWTVANHWLHAGGDYGWPYSSLGYSNTTNWLDYFLADFSFGNWTFSLGKDMIQTGGFEYDEWDWDIHPTFASYLWNTLPCYQWGGKVAFTTPSEMTNLALQVTASPLVERPFEDGKGTLSFMWRGEYGWYSNIWSATAMEAYGNDNRTYLYALGNRFTFSDEWSWTLDLQLMTRSIDYYEADAMYGAVLNTVSYCPSDKLDFALKGGFYGIGDKDDFPAFDSDASFTAYNIGIIANFYPLKDSSLRLHGFLNYNSEEGGILGIGATYNLRVFGW